MGRCRPSTSLVSDYCEPSIVLGDSPMLSPLILTTTLTLDIIALKFDSLGHIMVMAKLGFVYLSASRVYTLHLQPASSYIYFYLSVSAKLL